jgi:glycosyltransferase involved in cell wall biosynthesis
MSSLWLSGGVQVILEYANRMCERGHQVCLVTPRNAVDEEIARMLSPLVSIQEGGFRPDKRMSWINKMRLAWELARIVPSSDVVIATHTPSTLVSFLSSKLFRHQGLLIWFYMDYPGMFSNLSVEMCLLRNAMHWHTAALVLSKYSTQELSLMTNKEIIPVGLGLSHYELLKPIEKDLSTPGDKKVILYLGDFRPRKGLQDFLHAAEIVYTEKKDIELWLALKENGKIRTNVPYKLFFRPSIHHLSELYATCDLFVSASWFEGFGLPPLEAMACGAPVVLTNSGGVQDFAIPGENCLMVPPQQPVALAEAILEVLNNPEKTRAFRKAGPCTAAKFTWEAAVDRFETALLKLIN